MVRIRKTIGALLLLAAAASPAIAQQGTGAESSLSKVQAFEHNGIRVIMSPAENELVSIIVGLEGGRANGQTTNPEMGPFAAQVVAASGSKNLSKDDLRTFLSRTSTRLSGDGDLMGVAFRMTSTRARFDEAWGIVSSMLREPSFDEVEFRNMQQRRIINIQSQWSDPESESYLLADSLLRLGHPVMSRRSYEKDVEALTIPALQSFFKSVQERSRLVVVVVGDVTRAEIEEKLADFTKWPAGSYTRPKLVPIAERSGPKVEVLDRPASPTTYIMAGYVGPEINDEDYWPLAIGASYLGDVLFEEIRTKRNLSYAPGAWFGQVSGKGMGFMSVSTVFPDSSMTIMLRELQKMKDGDFDEKKLEDAKQVYTTRYYMREMTNMGKANAMYNAERFAGDWRQAFSYDRILAVDKKAVKKAFAKWAKNLQVGVAGSRSKVTDAKFLYTNTLSGK